MTVDHRSTGPLAGDARYREVLADRTAHGRATARGTAAWTEDSTVGGAQRAPLRVPELLIGFLLALEAFSLGVGETAFPVNELAMLVLLGLALLRRARMDTSTLGVAGLLTVLVGLFLGWASLHGGIADADWVRRLVRILALALLVWCFAGRRLDLRSALTGLLTAMLVNVPLFYLGLVPAPYGSYLTGFLGDKNVAGLYYAALPILALAFVRRPGRRVLIVLVAAVLVFLTGSRTAMAGFACAVVWVLLTPRWGAGSRLVLLGLMAWGVSYAEENLARIGIFAEREDTDWLRSTIQDATAGKVATTPWHGRGLTTAYVEIEDRVWHYHDSYAGLYTEGGIVLLTAILAAYAVYGLRLFSSRLRTPARVAVEAAAVVVCVTATQLGEVFLTIPSMLVLAAGVSLAMTERDLPLEQQVLDRRREEILARARARGV